jgi:methanogenic corrinoid protein MtbC1
VKGDLHDIGKNLCKLMIEGKGIEVIDLGSDVSAEQYLQAYKEKGATIIGCSALLTTTMGEMKNVVDIFVKEGLRDKVTILIGGSPITDGFRQSIGADYYTTDAASCAEVAKKVLSA